MAVAPAKSGKPSPILAEIGPRFAKALKAVGRKQLHVAKELGIDQPRLSKFGKGKVGLESETLLALFKLAAEAGISIDGYVLRGIGSPVREEPLILATTPELAQGLRELATRVEKSRHPSSKPPGPGNKRQ